jgi:tripeptide aminopeptidase
LGADGLVGLFCELVAVDSESMHEGEIAALVESRLSQWGCKVRRDGAGRRIGSDAGNLYVRAGNSTGSHSLLLSAHLDTVKPGRGVVPRVGKRVIRSDGRRVLGADDKAGLAIAMGLLREAAEGKMGRCGLEAVFSVAEERGILGIKHANRGWLRSKRALVLDGSGRAASVIISSPTQYNLKLVFQGRKAHAGVEPEKGVSAIEAASRAISRMRLGRIDPLTTANMGIIGGGTAVNIVPDRVEVMGEARSLDRKRLESQVRSMKEAAMDGASSVGAAVYIEVRQAYEGYALPADDPLVKLVVEAGESLGMHVETCSSGGGSDANQLNAWGITAVVLNTGAFNPHSEKEYLDIREFGRAYGLCRRIIELHGAGGG